MNKTTKKVAVKIKEREDNLDSHPINNLKTKLQDPIQLESSVATATTSKPNELEKNQSTPRAYTTIPESEIDESSIAVIYHDVVNGKKIKRILTKDIETILIETANDLNLDISVRREAFSKLLQAYDRYIKFIVHKEYRNNYIDKDDLSQAAFEGFATAVRKYDKAKAAGTKFISFIYYYVKRSVNNLVNQLSYSTKILTTKDAYTARTAIARIRAERDPTLKDYEEIAKTLNNRTASFVQSIDAAFYSAHTDTVAETVTVSDSSESSFQPRDHAPNAEVSIEEEQYVVALRQKFFHAFNNDLNDMERYIVKVRVATDFFPEVTQKSKLREIAEKFGVSTQRIRQIEENAIKKLRKALSSYDPNNQD